MGIASNRHTGLQDRKRFKCPICNQYTLLIEGDGKSKCSNNCSINSKRAQIALKKNDFDGYYTTKELEDIWGYDSYDESTEMKHPVKNSLFTKNQSIKLQEITNNTRKFNNYLDDLSIEYLRKFPERDTPVRDLNQFEYFLNLIEDINVSLNRMSKDMFLMDVSYQVSKFPTNRDMMFSLTYFYFNLSHHFYEFVERTVICLGILFHVHFHNDPKANSKSFIMKELKKNEGYKNSDLKRQMEKITSNNTYHELVEWRATSTHDLSKHLNNMKEKNIDINKDRADIDKELLEDSLNGIIKMLALQYDLYEMILHQLEPLFSEPFDTNAINMIKGTGESEELIISSKRPINDILLEEYERNTQRIEKLLEKGRKDRAIINIHDVVFRMFEIIKSCHYAISIDDPKFRERWKKYKMDFVLDCMDRQYLSYSSAMLVFSCYDKIARHLSAKYSLYAEGEMVYFDTFLDDSKHKIEELLLCKEIQKNNAYQFLVNYRNTFTHVIRKGCVYTDTMEHYEDYLLIAVAYNIQHLSSLLDKIL